MNAPTQKPNRMSAREVEANERGCTVCEFCGGREDGCNNCGGDGELPAVCATCGTVHAPVADLMDLFDLCPPVEGPLTEESARLVADPDAMVLGGGR